MASRCRAVKRLGSSSRARKSDSTCCRFSGMDSGVYFCAMISRCPRGYPLEFAILNDNFSPPCEFPSGFLESFWEAQKGRLADPSRFSILPDHGPPPVMPRRSSSTRSMALVRGISPLVISNWVNVVLFKVIPKLTRSGDSIICHCWQKII